MGNNVSLMSVDLPLPETPVTHINEFKGKVTLTSFKLFPLAFSKLIWKFKSILVFFNFGAFD